jgi:hypothetical protein
MSSPHRTHLTLNEVEGTRVAAAWLAPERAVHRRSRRIAEQRRGVEPVTRPAVVDESTVASNAEEEDFEMIPEGDKIRSQMERQCVRVLSNFGDAKWQEAQENNQCSRRWGKGDSQSRNSNIGFPRSGDIVPGGNSHGVRTSPSCAGGMAEYVRMMSRMFDMPA